VKRDSITRTLSTEGSVTPQSQVPINYPTRGTVADVRVKPGDSVSEGDELLEMDATEANRSLASATARLQASQLALAQGQAQVVAQHQQAAQQAAVDQRNQQQATADAQTVLRHAQENLSKVMAGASVTDLRAAQDAVDKAQAALQKAQDGYTKLTSGADPTAVRNAQRDVTTNQTALAKAQDDLNTLLAGADPSVIRAAQGDVQKAQTQLQIAQTARIDPKAPDPAVAKIQHDAAIQDAQMAVQAAQAKLDKIKQPPADTDVQTSRQKLQTAQDALSTAQDRLTSLQAPPDDATLEGAQAAVDRAQQAADDAQTQLRNVQSHPTPAEIADAQDQIRKAQVAVNNAQRGASTQVAAAGTAVDVNALQGVVAQDQASVASLQDALETMKLRAPFDGTVVSVKVKPGDPVTSLKPVMILAKPGPPLLHLDLDDSQVALLSVGQPAAVNYENPGVTTPPMDGKIVAVTPASLDGSASAQASVQVNWGDGDPPKFGTLMSVSVTLQKKDSVLVVPKNAVRQAGGKASVEVLDGTLRHLIPVQVGIQSDTSVEIVSGVSEGQLVVVTGS
jgi:HlyD family secretion protein